MNISLFNKKYWVRRFEEPKTINGYFSSGYKDFVASLHIHVLGTDKVQVLPEGQRSLNHLEGHGNIELMCANQDKGQKADLLYYHGSWYECVGVQRFDHTLLSHFNYQFVLVPEDGSGSVDTKNPPQESPESWNGGDTQ